MQSKTGKNQLGPMKKLLPLFQCYPQAGRQVGKTEKGAAISSSDLILRKTGFLAVSIVRDMRKLYFSCSHYFYFQPMYSPLLLKVRSTPPPLLKGIDSVQFWTAFWAFALVLVCSRSQSRLNKAKTRLKQG